MHDTSLTSIAGVGFGVKGRVCYYGPMGDPTLFRWSIARTARVTT